MTRTSEEYRRVQETLLAQLSTQGVAAQHPPSETILPPVQSRQSIQPGRSVPGALSVSSLPKIRLGDTAQAGEFELREVLGEGGMGIVRSAWQPALGREVAIKTLHATAGREDARTALLYEAQVSGSLEHPNIVPVHAVGHAESHGPALVMKRVAGTSWSALIGDLAHPDWEGRAGDALERHLALCIQICHAVEFAHSRGVIHRDIKPANVMVGRFGEVYLLDWGVALRVDELGGADRSTLVGTPAYMAPEMVLGTSPIDARTDVYLLGATLYEAVTGSPPHAAETSCEALIQASQGDLPAFDAEVPAELAQVIERACDPVPTERYDSVEAFRGALVSYLDHRGSLTVMRAAEERLSVLKQAVSAGQLDGVGTQETAAGLDQLFSACRFGFEQALEAWPENQGAQDGLQCCLETMIRHELSARLHRSAAALIRDLPRARPDLAAECDQLRQEVLVQEKAQEQLRTLRREAQLHGENWRRSRVLAVNGVLWCLGLGAVAVGVRSGMSVPAPHQNLVFGLFWLAAAGGMRYVLRRQLAENVRFGQFMAASTFLPLAAVVNRLLTLVTARSFYETLVTDYVIVFVCLGIGAATMERALWLPTAVVGTGAFLAGVHPELSLEIAAVLALFVNVHIAWLLRPRGGRVTATLNPEGSN